MKRKKDILIDNVSVTKYEMILKLVDTGMLKNCNLLAESNIYF